MRELKNALGYAVIHCARHADRARRPAARGARRRAPGAPAADLPLDERARIVAALARTGGERKAAAALLGIGRATLYRKLAQFGME